MEERERPRVLRASSGAFPFFGDIQSRWITSNVDKNNDWNIYLTLKFGGAIIDSGIINFVLIILQFQTLK